MELNWLFALGIFALLALTVLLLFVACKKGYRQQVFELLYSLVCRAEAAFEGSGRGAEKKAWVVDRIHDKLPGWAKLLISEQDIDALLELAVDKMKALLSTAATQNNK